MTGGGYWWQIMILFRCWCCCCCCCWCCWLWQLNYLYKSTFIFTGRQLWRNSICFRSSPNCHLQVLQVKHKIPLRVLLFAIFVILCNAFITHLISSCFFSATSSCSTWSNGSLMEKVKLEFKPEQCISDYLTIYIPPSPTFQYSFYKQYTPTITSWSKSFVWSLSHCCERNWPEAN